MHIDAPLVAAVASLITSLSAWRTALRPAADRDIGKVEDRSCCVLQGPLDESPGSEPLLMQHDMRLRAAARAIFDACYPSDDWSAVRFDEAERFGTIHYRQAVDAAKRARTELAAPAQPRLL